MLHRLALTAAVLVATSTAACAEFYHIRLDGHCDQFSFTVVDGVAAGVSDSPQPLCDQAYLIGSRLYVQKSIAPGGDIIALASDFGPFNSGFVAQFIVYLNTRTHKYVSYFSDGHKLFAEPGEFSNIKDDEDLTKGPALPPLSATIRRFGKAVAP